MNDPVPAAQRLSRRACFDLLASGGLGRLAFSERALPAIATVHFAVVDETLFFQVAPDAEWVRAQPHAVVAFQAESGDPQEIDSWTVSAVGVLNPVSNPDFIESLRALPAWSALAPAGSTFLRLDLHDLEGTSHAMYAPSSAGSGL
jgi:nitroimidazol reductase NimA-like FMN-containing flavoprotein (pyridoxamine 5'-phosphate oxidase superfamily)